MKTHIHYHNIGKTAQAELEELMHHFVEQRLESRLSKYDSGLAQLQVNLEKNNYLSRYQVTLQLTLASSILTSEEEASELAPAMHDAFTELAQQLKRHVSYLRDDDTCCHKERRHLLHRLKNAMNDGPAPVIAQFGDLLRPLLPTLQRFVRRELSYLRTRGDLTPGYPTLEDLIDEVLVRAYQELKQHPDKIELRTWLYQVSLSVLREEVERHQTEEGLLVSIEARALFDPTQTLDEKSESIFYYWEPEEIIELENVIPAAHARPEEAVNNMETRKYLASFLATLPTAWRRALVLSQAEELPLPVVARQLRASEDEVKRWIAQADDFLRARLKEVGFGPTVTEQPSIYLAPLSSTDTPELMTLFDEMTHRKK